jgi:hypothetical protein
MRNTNEIWKPIKGYEGLYEVSNLGNVKSLNYSHTGKPKLLKLCKLKNGYLMVQLSKNSVTEKRLVHRLVAQAFLPNPDNLPEVNHKSEIKSQNNVENLEWCSSSYNHSYGTGTKRMVAKRNNNNCNNAEKPVKQITLNGTLVTIWPNINEAGRNGFNIGCISMCCNGKRNSHKGYLWEFA